MVAELDRLLAELTSGDDLRAETALLDLARLGDEALPGLLSLLESTNPDHRWWATTALSAIDHPQARAAMCQALNDTDAGVRQCAALGLRQQPASQALPALIDALGEADTLLARLASDALTALGSDAVSPLTIAMRSEDLQVRVLAARALAGIDDPATVPPLFAALDDPSPLVVFWAEQGLEHQGVGMVFFRP